MLNKIYGNEGNDRKHNRRYSPAVCIEAIPTPIIGSSDPNHISTSHVERLNLTTRMSVRRFTRLTNAFSKKLQNHTAAISLHFAYYNYCRKHQTLGTSPAVAAGLTDHIWNASGTNRAPGICGGHSDQARQLQAPQVQSRNFKVRHYLELDTTAPLDAVVAAILRHVA